MKIKLLTLFLLLTAFLALSAQGDLVYVDPVETYEKARFAFAEEKYETAIAMLDSIHRYDSNYFEAFRLKTAAYFTKEDYGKVLVLCQIYPKSDLQEHYYSIKIFQGLALMRLEKYMEAVLVFEGLLAHFPKSHLVYYNLAYCFEQLEELEKATSHYKQCVILNPTYAPPHLQLGKICLAAGLYSQAMLCFNTNLLFDPNSSGSLNALATINTAVSSKPEIEPKSIAVSPDDGAFKSIDLIIGNYAALNQNYKIPSKISYPLAKQNHLLLQKLSGFKGNNGFWENTYVKFYDELFKKGYFDFFVYRISASTTNEKYQKIIEKKNKASQGFVDWIYARWPETVGNCNFGNPAGSSTYYYDKEGYAEAFQRTQEDSLYDTYHEFYFKNGNLLGKGHSLDGKREGCWTKYFENGQIFEEMVYKNDTLQGLYKQFHENDALQLSCIITNGEFDGVVERYNEFGVLVDETEYKNDAMHGKSKIYYPIGKGFVKYGLQYDNWKANGLLTKYYPHGEMEFQVEMENDLMQGEETQYYPNGQISAKYNYANNQLHGQAFVYHENGQLSQKGQYQSGYQTGKWEDYYVTGELASVSHYNDKGGLHGKYQKFRRDGKMYRELEYKNNKLVYYKHLDNNGETLAEASKPKGNFSFVQYNPNNSILAKGEFLPNGERTGVWKYCSENGFPTVEEHYKNGTIQGEAFGYYPNGSLQSITTYGKGIMDGLYQSFYIDSTIKQEGHYKNSMAERFWKTYFPDGTLEQTSFYFRENNKGSECFYSVDGKLHSKNCYENGFMVYTLFYDTLGIVLDSIAFFGDTLQTRSFPNGGTKAEYSLLNGFIHGKFASYYINGKTEVRGGYFYGNVHRKWEWFNNQGVLTVQGEYYHGKKNGKWLYWHDNGTLRNACTYVNDQLHGEYISYDENGNTDYQGNYIYGLENGEFRFYHNGILQMARYYDFGEVTGYAYENKEGALIPIIPIEKETGHVRACYPNGNVSREYAYVDGEFNGRYIKYNQNSQTISVDNYIAGVEYGESAEYYDNGQTKFKTNYLNGLLHGKYIEYYKNGNIKKNLNYLNGVLSGTGLYYDKNGEIEKKIVYFNGDEYSIETY